MGGYIHWRGCMIKSWSRRIPVPCLSSAEAELFTLVEGRLGLAMILEMMVDGRPRRKDTGFYERDTGLFALELRTDSQAAQSIAGMQGLLRRVRHLELRVAVLQYYVTNGRLSIQFVPGAANGSDALTKPGGLEHQRILLEDMGLCKWSGSQNLDSLLDTLVNGLGSMSSQNKWKIKHGLGRLARFLVEKGKVETMGSDFVEMCRELEVGTEETPYRPKQRDAAMVSEPYQSKGAEVVDVVGDSQSSVEGSPKKRVSFSEEPQICAVQSRKLPRRWNRFMNQYPQFEQFREQIALGFAGVPIFLELCCRKMSTFETYLRNRPVVHIGIDESLDIRKKETQLFVREVLKVSQKGTTVWISTPCTAGCQLRHLNLTKEGYHEKWQKHFILHQQLWRGVFAALKDFDASVTLLVQEWPEYNSLWSDNTYRKIAEKLGMVRGNLKVKRCCFDGIMKVWEIASNSSDFLEFCQKMVPSCSCNVKSHTIPYEETGYYSSEVCKFFWNVVERFLQKRWASHVIDGVPLLPCLQDDRVSENAETFGSVSGARPSGHTLSCLRSTPIPSCTMGEAAGPVEVKIGCSVSVIHGDYEGRRGLVVRVTTKKAVVQFDDQQMVDIESPPEQRTLLKSNLKVLEPRPEVQAMVGENWDPLRFRRLMPAPGSDVFEFDDVARMRAYVENMENRIFQLAMTRGDIQSRIEKLEREMNELRTTVKEISELEGQIDPRLTAVKVALRVYGLGGQCLTIQLPVASQAEARGPQQDLPAEASQSSEPRTPLEEY